jgi:hypothetical protein
MCDPTCEFCRTSQTGTFKCVRTGTGSSKYVHGKLPEIKPRGFIYNFQTQNCTSETGTLSFVTDGMCFSQENNLFGKKDKRVKSTASYYNNELNQAESIGYDNSKCSGNVISKDVYPLQKCFQIGNSVFKIEKP